MGLLLMLKKQCGDGDRLQFVRVPRMIRAAMRLNGFEDLLGPASDK
jgi:hypothetical protein